MKKSIISLSFLAFSLSVLMILTNIESAKAISGIEFIAPVQGEIIKAGSDYTASFRINMGSLRFDNAEIRIINAANPSRPVSLVNTIIIRSDYTASLTFKAPPILEDLGDDYLEICAEDLDASDPVKKCFQSKIFKISSTTSSVPAAPLPASGPVFVIDDIMLDKNTKLLSVAVKNVGSEITDYKVRWVKAEDEENGDLFAGSFADIKPTERAVITLDSGKYFYQPKSTVADRSSGIYRIIAYMADDSNISLRKTLALGGVESPVSRIESTDIPSTTISSQTVSYPASSSTSAVLIDNLNASDAIAVGPSDPKPVSKEAFIAKMTIRSNIMAKKLSGKIILKVQSKGEAYYVNPNNKTMHYLGNSDDAYKVMREQGVGIKNRDLAKIPVGMLKTSGNDTDGDGLTDSLEDAIGTDKAKKDTDGDGFDDGSELNSGYDVLKGGGTVKSFDSSFSKKQKGKIFIQVEGRGEAWYVSPVDNKRYFLGRASDAYELMRKMGLGISNTDFEKL